MKSNKYIYLFSCCVTVKGHSRSTICDLQRNKFKIIPNSLYEILAQLDQERNLIALRTHFKSEEDKEIFDSYINFLIEEEFIFMDDVLHNRLEPIDLELFDIPSLISNSIIDYSGKYSINLLDDFISQLDMLRCEAVEVRIFKKINERTLYQLLDFFNDKGIRCINLILHFDNYMTQSFFEKLGNEYRRIREISIFNYLKKSKFENLFYPIYYLKNPDFSEIHCGFVSPEAFYVNIQNFTESKKFNSCLNKKLSLDESGNIKNCPSMKKSFGNINLEYSLTDIAKQNAFQKDWTITKDLVQVCKDCEFRYVCTDCRAYTVENKKMEKPFKCSYDPYKGEWQV